jgi:hypothetical protein
MSTWWLAGPCRSDPLGVAPSAEELTPSPGRTSGNTPGIGPTPRLDVEAVNQIAARTAVRRRGQSRRLHEP